MRPASVLILVVLCGIPLTTAAPLDTGTAAMVTLRLGDSVLVACTPTPADGDATFHVYGLTGGVSTHLGTVQAPFTSFLAPAGYEQYVVKVEGDQGERAMGGVCIMVDQSQTPPNVGVNFRCGSTRVLRGAVHPTLP